ncbi:Terpenoid cyclases/protein prenyltransferase alpha-alpha toroid [Sesbania bispinosa]|nr:Terpenoid cyclases/protein prenyltransferase alpha-alpha toroid [Sesbania bispinosa]
MKKQAETLKGEVKKMFLSSVNHSISQKLKLIDSIKRLGVSHHFEHEIDEALEQIHSTVSNKSTIIADGDLHFLALLFRLLRQQGYRISSDIFNKFKNNEGKFNEVLATDVQGLCSLYEATHLRAHGEDILDEALDFTYTHLKSLANQLNPSLSAQINHCLRQPFHKRVTRLEARYHITVYEEDPSHEEILLTFAKEEFNILQKMHQKEIGNITKWWKNSNFVTKVPYARERVVEPYLFLLAMSCEPPYTYGRMIVGKLTLVISLLDDTYDSYGTIQELELFTKAIQRWDISLIGPLPQCMRVVFDTIVEMHDEIESVTVKSGKSSFVMPLVKQAICSLIKAYMVEAKWCHESYIPTYDEYKANGILTSASPLMIISFLGLGEFETKKIFDWIFNDPSIIKATSIIGRLVDDIASHKFEQQRVHVASAVECCIKQYNISQQEAYNLIQKDVEDCWKVINEECLKPNDIPKFVHDCVINFARICEFLYEDQEDKYTNGELLKDCISSLLIDPICIKQN